MERKRRQGRPPTLLNEDREYLAELIRQHGIRGARRETTMSVSQTTLIKIAREFNIQLGKGRRRKLAA